MLIHLKLHNAHVHFFVLFFWGAIIVFFVALIRYVHVHFHPCSHLHACMHTCVDICLNVWLQTYVEGCVQCAWMPDGWLQSACMAACIQTGSFAEIFDSDCMHMQLCMHATVHWKHTSTQINMHASMCMAARMEVYVIGIKTTVDFSVVCRPHDHIVF